MNSDDLYSDVEKFRDGSGRWLWQVLLHLRLWRAGICFGKVDAEKCAARELENCRLLREAKVRRMQSFPPDEPAIDFDELDRSGPGPGPG